MSDEELKLVHDAVKTISKNSILTETEVIEIIKDSLIPLNDLVFFVKKIIELSKHENNLSIIKIEIYSILAQRSFRKLNI